jgi:hypothetical protein
MLRNAAGRNSMTNESTTVVATTKGGLGFYFDGGLAKLYDNSFNAISNLPVTMMAWAYLDPANIGTGTIMTLTVGVDLATLLHLVQTGVTGKIEARHYDGTNSVASANSVVTAARWYHVAGVFASMSRRQVWVNGRFLAENTGTNSSWTTPNRFAIGYAPFNPGQPLLGTVLAPVIVNRALGADEIRRHMQNPWNIVAPRQIIIPSAAAASYALSNPMMHLLTATSGYPRVDVTVT